MPIVPPDEVLDKRKESQKFCKLCREESQYNKFATICDLCSNWICLDCSEIPEPLYTTIKESNPKLTFFCQTCSTELPRLREIMQLKQNQQQITKEVNTLKQSMENVQKVQKDLEARITANEKAIAANPYPTLGEPAINEEKQKWSKLFETHQTQSQQMSRLFMNKQPFDMEEAGRRESKKDSLIIYGIPEPPTEIDPIAQMKEDFKTLQTIYDGRTALEKTDFTDITRLGTKKTDKIRPIKITCVSQLKRKDILTNNLGLKLEGDHLKECDSCDQHGKHIHIYVTTDKTKQEQEAEKILRKELKKRKDDGEDVLIRRGRIVTRTAVPALTIPRWTEVSEDV